MSMRYPGGFIASTPVTANYPSGVWTQAQAIPYQAQNVWTRDQYWPYTTLLLQGDGAVNGAQNNTFLDSSTNNFTITRNGNTTQGSFTPYEQDGYWSNYFDTSQYINAGANSAYALGSSDWTMEMFVYITAIPSAIDILGNWAGTALYTNSQFLWRINSNGTHSFYYFATSTGSQTSVTTGAPSGSLSTNRWYHFVLTKSGTTLTPFQDGVAGSTATVSTSTLYGTATSTALSAGVNNGGGNTNNAGYVSNVRLTIGQVLYTSNFTPSTSPLTTTSQGATAGNVKLLTCQSNRFKDNSTNAFAITVNGSPSVQAFQPFPGATTWSASVLGGSGYFDGSGDYLQTPSNSAFNFSATDCTIEFWYYGAASSGLAVEWGTGASGDMQVEFSGGSVTFGPSGGASKTFFALQANAWNYIAAVKTGTTYYIFINGTRNTSSSGTAASSAQIVNIGCRNGGTVPITGYIADLRVSNTARYTNTTMTVPTAPLTNIANTSLLLNMTNAGIYDNSMMNDLETVGNAQVSTSVVKYGTGSMAFDGSGDYLQLPSGNQIYNLSSGDWTVECWVYFNTFTTTTTPHLWTIGTNTDNRYSVYRESSGGKLSFVTANAGSYTFANGTTTVATGTWYHVAVVRNNGVSRLYVNGVQEASSTTAINSGTSVFVGFLGYGSAAADYLNGYIDDLRITKAARYLTSFTPPPARMPGQ